MFKKVFVVICLILLHRIAAISLPLTTKKLIVGTKLSAPFAMKGPDGNWTGISIELWRKIAADLHLEYEFREYDLKGLVQAVRDSSVDVAIAALSITSERERMFDFSHPYYNSGLSIAVLPPGKSNWTQVFEHFLSLKLLITIAILAVGTVVVGTLMWVLERTRNPQQFGGDWKQGIGAGLWWSAVTMTTVGYGDKTPTTMFGRLIALVWMFTAIIIISVFTATVTATLTVSQLETSIKGPDDLPKAHVGTVAGSTSERYLQAHHVRYQLFKTAIDGLNAVAHNTIDAMVYDAPLLRYLANSELNGAVYVLPTLFERQYYGIALPAGSPLRKEINQVLLDETHQAQWADILYQYLGE